jgi:N-methylhydantoinase B
MPQDRNLQVGYDPTDLAVLSSRFDGIVREMQNTLLRAGRSSMMALARDFSCCIVDSQDRLAFSAEGLPVHVYGSGLLTRSMVGHHPDLAEGDAFLHNDPYDGNTHAADHSLLVPVFVDGEHLFTAIAKAHQADIGNSVPTTYMPTARDVYQEGALIFPCVRIQRNYSDVEDIIRMCRRRIRVPEVWYGDYLATVAAGRIAERRLKALCAQFGTQRIREFVSAWLDYSEGQAREAIAVMPAGTFTGTTTLDPFPGLDDGLDLSVTLEFQPEEGRVGIDLRDNPDCVPLGLNLTEATAKNSAVAAMLMVLNSMGTGTDVPLNEGSFRRFDVLLRENCVAGIPRHPASCSLATGDVGVRIWAAIMSTVAETMEGAGSAQASFGGAPYIGVISGVDLRSGRPYINQLFAGTAGGPATVASDGWLSFVGFPAAGLLYRDSVEVDEQKYPIIITRSEVRLDSEGPGRRRGAPGNYCEFGPISGAMDVYYSFEGVQNRPLGVRGGESPAGPEAYVIDVQGRVQRRPEAVGAVTLAEGELIGSLSAGGGGYGLPTEREPVLVLTDVREGYLSPERARARYGVVIEGDPMRPEALTVDVAATAKLRRAP